jgi:hypothetical protein
MLIAFIAKYILQIPNRFWCPDKLIKTITSIDQSPPITYSHPLPKPPNDQLICYANSSGLSYELAAVRETIINGSMLLFNECPEICNRYWGKIYANIASFDFLENLHIFSGILVNIILLSKTQNYYR